MMPFYDAMLIDAAAIAASMRYAAPGTPIIRAPAVIADERRH